MGILESAPEHGCTKRHRAPRLQPIEPAHEGIAQGGRDASLARLAEGQIVIKDCPNELLDVERNAFGAIDDLRDLEGAQRLLAGDGFRELGGVAGQERFETLDDEAAREQRTTSGRDSRRQKDRQPCRVGSTEKQADEVTRRRIGPVEVLKDEADSSAVSKDSQLELSESALPALEG